MNGSESAHHEQFPGYAVTSHMARYPRVNGDLNEWCDQYPKVKLVRDLRAAGGERKFLMCVAAYLPPNFCANC